MPRSGEYNHKRKRKVACSDCGAPYGSDGWCDIVVPDAIWNQIAPEGGVLCFRCMTRRITAHGLDRVPVIVASGPYTDANEEWRMAGWRQGYKVGLAKKETSDDLSV